MANITAFIFCKDEGNETRFLVLSLWRDLEAVRAFAGEEYEKARYYPEDKQFLLDLTPYVEHFEVLEPSSV